MPEQSAADAPYQLAIIDLNIYRRELLRMMLVSGKKLTVVGLGAGLVAGVFVCRAMRSMLFGVSAIDAPPITAVIGVLLLCALAACYIPARRATKADPLVALSAG